MPRPKNAAAPKTGTPERREKTAQLARDVSAYDAARAARPLKPPPLRTETHMVSSGALALAQDIKKGAYVPGRAMIEIESFAVRGGNGGGSHELGYQAAFKVSR